MPAGWQGPTSTQTHFFLSSKITTGCSLPGEGKSDLTARSIFPPKQRQGALSPVKGKLILLHAVVHSKMTKSPTALPFPYVLVAGYLDADEEDFVKSLSMDELHPLNGIGGIVQTCR